MIETIANFVGITCSVCSISFQVPRGFYEARNRDGSKFYCPSGHQLWYGDNEMSRLKAELARAQASKAYHEERSNHYRESMLAEQNRSRGLKSALTLTKKRIAKGKCPCCDKIFDDLRQHIAEKHKEYKVKITK